ncbi:MAG: hypothetical protein Q4A71_05035 [Actinomycetaceae bacterium]|nr:hypothetical protein [Actinomycetaceae bacterium]
MYGLLWRLLPGGVLLKLLACLVMLTGAVILLFTWVYPWVQDYLHLSGNTVGH